MEQEETPSPEYVKGFNEGYTLTQHLPELAGQLGQTSLEDVRGVGFQDGRKQFLLEQVREQYPSWLKGDHPQKEDQSPTKDKDWDLEPDR